jgi:hypothetical protein
LNPRAFAVAGIEQLQIQYTNFMSEETRRNATETLELMQSSFPRASDALAQKFVAYFDIGVTYSLADAHAANRSWEVLMDNIISINPEALMNSKLTNKLIRHVGGLLTPRFDADGSVIDDLFPEYPKAIVSAYQRELFSTYKQNMISILGARKWGNNMPVASIYNLNREDLKIFQTLGKYGYYKARAFLTDP